MTSTTNGGAVPAEPTYLHALPPIDDEPDDADEDLEADHPPAADVVTTRALVLAAYRELAAAGGRQWTNAIEEERVALAVDLVSVRAGLVESLARAGYTGPGALTRYLEISRQMEAPGPSPVTTSGDDETVPWMDTPPTPDALAETPDASVRPAHELPVVWTVKQLAELPSADEEFIIADGILTRGGKMLVYAKSGAGKTTFLDFIAGPLAAGTPFLGRYPVDRPRRVLVIQGELSQAEMASHAQALVGAGYDPDGLLFTRMTNLKLPGGEAMLRKLAAHHHADVLALDPWYRLFTGESSDKPEQVGLLFDVCDRMLEDGLVEAIIVVHHANVSGLRTAGSWVFEGWPSTILRLETVPGLVSQRKLTFEKVRAPSSTLMSTSVMITLGESGYALVVPAVEPTGAGEIIAVLIVREVGGSIHRRDLLERLKARAQVKDRAANKYLGAAVQAGLLVSVPDRGEAVYQLGPKALADGA